MIDENDPIQPVQPVEQPSDRRRWFSVWMLVFHLFACALCAGLTVYTLLPLTSELLGVFDQEIIPVTGDAEPANTSEQALPGMPQPSYPSEEERLPSINPQSRITRRLSQRGRGTVTDLLPIL